MELQEGKLYRMRNGEVVGPLVWDFTLFRDNKSGKSWDRTGKWDLCSREENTFDIVAEAGCPDPPAPLQWKRQVPDKPGIWAFREVWGWRTEVVHDPGRFNGFSEPLCCFLGPIPVILDEPKPKVTKTLWLRAEVEEIPLSRFPQVDMRHEGFCWCDDGQVPSMRGTWHKTTTTREFEV